LPVGRGRFEEDCAGAAADDASGFFEEWGEYEAHEETADPVGEVDVVREWDEEGFADDGPDADGGTEAETDGEGFGEVGEEERMLGREGVVDEDRAKGGWEHGLFFGFVEVGGVAAAVFEVVSGGKGFEVVGVGVGVGVVTIGGVP